MTTLLPGSNLGRYQVLEQIGQGGMATVFRAHDPNLNREVAIKVLPSFLSDNPALVDRFSQEAHAVARLTHPNIITIHDFGEDKGFTLLQQHFEVQELTERPMTTVGPGGRLGPWSREMCFWLRWSTWANTFDSK